jgi:hypothetical protein
MLSKNRAHLPGTVMRVWLPLMAACGLSACTADDVMRPSIDVGTTQAVPQALPQQVVTPQYQPQASAPTYSAAAPVLMVTPDGVVQAPPGMAQTAVVPRNPMPNDDTGNERDLEPVQDEPGMLAQLAALPGMLVPGFLKPGGSGPEAKCRRELKRLGVKFEDISSVGNGGGGGCGIANPVKVSGLSGRITVKPAAVLNCQMALAFAEWVKKDVQPAARLRYLSGVDTIKQMSSYSCRTIGNKRGGRLSEHSFGNAIDIGGIILNNGRQVMVRKPGFFALRESSLLNSIRADACDRFTTVLGPGYDKAHADHFHLDLMTRRRKTCE